MVSKAMVSVPPVEKVAVCPVAVNPVAVTVVEEAEPVAEIAVKVITSVPVVEPLVVTYTSMVTVVPLGTVNPVIDITLEEAGEVITEPN